MVQPKLTSLVEDFKRLGLSVPGEPRVTTPSTTADPKVADLQVHKAVTAIRESLKGAQLTAEQISRVVAEASTAAEAAKSPVSEAAEKKAQARFAKFTTIAKRMAKKHVKAGITAKFHDLAPKAKGKLAHLSKPGHGMTKLAGESNSIASLLGDLQDVLGAHQALFKPEANEETAAFANLAIGADLLARALQPIQEDIANLMSEGFFDEETDGEWRDALVEMSEVVEAIAEMSAQFAEAIKHLALSEEDLGSVEESFKDMLGVFMTVLEMYDEYEEDWSLVEGSDDDDDADESKKDDDDDDDDDATKAEKAKAAKAKAAKEKKGPFGKAAS